MSTPPVSLILHTQRCKQSDPADGSRLWFSLNLSVAFATGANPPDELKQLVHDYLRPWTWQFEADSDDRHRATLYLAFTVAAGGFPGDTATPFRVTASTPSIAGDAGVSWRAALDARLEALLAKAEAAAFQWTPPEAGKRQEIVYDGATQAAVAAQRQWHVELLEWSRDPAPLPQHALLSWMFWVPRDKLPAGAAFVAAAPELAFKDRKRTPAWDADPNAPVKIAGDPSGNRPLARAANGAPLRWLYSDATDEPKVAAWVNETALDPADAAWPKGWAKLENAVYGRDWLAELEVRAAVLFDLPVLVVKYLGELAPLATDADDEARKSAAATVEAAAQGLKPLFEPALRDLVQTGATRVERRYPGAEKRKEAKPSLANDHGLASDALRELARAEGVVDRATGGVPAAFDADAAAILDRLEAWEQNAAGVKAWWDSVFRRLADPDNTADTTTFARMRGLHAALADDTRALELVMEQWDQVLAASAAWSVARRDGVRKAMEMLVPRRRLALMHLGARWDGVLADLARAGELHAPVAVRDAVRNALGNALTAYVRERIGGGDHPELPRTGGEVDTAAFLAWLTTSDGERKSYLERVVDGLLAGSGYDDEPAKHAEPLVLQVAALRSDRVAEPDPLAEVAGFGVMLRRGSDVHHLTLARVELPSTVLARTAVVPARLASQNGLRRCLVSYNNRPVTACSPAEELAARQGLTDPAVDGAVPDLRYTNPYVAKGDQDPAPPRLPALCFGQDYGAAAYVVGTAGNLPAAICEAEDPTRLKPTVDPDAITWQPVPYRRRVAVGMPRVESPDREKGAKNTEGDALAFPPIPPDVHPLAHALLPSGDGGEADPEKVDALRRSLVLLVPAPAGPRGVWKAGAHEFAFQIRPPSVDLEVWDRSFDFSTEDKRTRAQRQRVWRETFEHARDDPAAAAGFDATLDDPAVGGVLVTMTHLGPGAQKPRRTSGPIALEPTGTGGLAGERAAPLRCTVKTGQENVTLKNGVVEITVPEGEVWQVEIFPVLRNEFAPTFAASFGTTDGHVTVAPHRLVVEVATVPALPSAADLHRSLRARAVTGSPSGRAREPWGAAPVLDSAPGAVWRSEVAVDPQAVTDPAARAAFRWLHGVRLRVQRWRWNGRPLREAHLHLPGDAGPFDPAVFFAAWEDDGKVGAWDGRLFGDRDPLDYRVHDAMVEFGDDPGAGAYRIDLHDESADRSAIYYRYSVEAQSRYAGLMNTPPSVDSRAAGAPGEAWRRLVVPCRFAGALPQPRAKLILPLTDTGDAAPGSAAPVLVVLNEPWFRYGGLAEDLVAELEVARDPTVATGGGNGGGGEGVDRLQLGPDPIVRNHADAAIVPGPGAEGTWTVGGVPLYGPIGFTFDADAAAPEFVHTAFVLPAPEVKVPEGTPPPNLAWWFAKLRLRRRIEPAAIFPPRPDAVVSEPTGAAWTQFLPPSSVFAAGGRRVAVRDLRLCPPKTGVAGWFLSADGGATPTALEPTAPEVSPARFQLWALVTEPRFDAFGRASQSAFLDFCPLAGGVLRPSANTTWASGTGKAREVRIVEVQILPGEAGHLAEGGIGTVQDFFFPDHPENLREARARMVRVSPPVPPVS